MKAGTPPLHSAYIFNYHISKYMKMEECYLKLLVAQYATVATAHRAKSLQGQLGSSRQGIVYQEASVAWGGGLE